MLNRESRGGWQRYLPLPDFSRKIEGPLLAGYQCNKLVFDFSSCKEMSLDMKTSLDSVLILNCDIFQKYLEIEDQIEADKRDTLKQIETLEHDNKSLESRIKSYQDHSE